VSAASGEKRLALEALRAVCALIVLLNHSLTLYTIDAPEWLAAIARTSTEAVLLFFVLSGVVISDALNRRPRTVGEFSRDRVLRIYPVYLTAIALALLAALLLGQPQPLTVWLGNLLFLQSWTGAPVALLDYNRPLWSLPYEMLYYALVALGIYLGRRAVFVLIPLLALAWFARANPSANALLLMLGLGPAFFAGFWLVRLGDRLPTVPPALGVATGIGALVLARISEGAMNELLRQNLYALGSLPLLWSLYRYAPSRPGAALRLLAAIGALSYALYAFHHPLLAIAASWRASIGVPISLAIGIGLTVLLAVVMEWRVQPRVVGFFRKRSAAASARVIGA
jgi:peptidoglycan/LPS O-acetylase OafA/YrhL